MRGVPRFAGLAEQPPGRAAEAFLRHAAKSAVPAAKPAEKPAPPVLPPGEWHAFVDPEAQISPLCCWPAPPSSPRRLPTAPAAKPGEKAPPAPDPIENLGDNNGLVGVTVASPADGAHARLVIRENALMETSSLDVDLPVKGRNTICCRRSTTSTRRSTASASPGR